MKNFLRPFHPDRWPPLIVLALRFALGVVLGIFAHYLFHRVSLPVEPFIYVAF